MECLFTPELRADTVLCRLPEEEARHARALRLREGDAVLLSNGAGVLARASIAVADRKEYTAAVHGIEPGSELSFRLVLALGVLDNRDRLEFALEKAVELGATDFVPLLTRYSRPGRVAVDRLRSKAVAAMKQAQRAVLTEVHEAVSLSSFLASFAGRSTVLLADADGGAWSIPQGDVCVVVGPEGGLDPDEVAAVRAVPGCVPVRLAERRLRAETAAVLAVGLAALP